MLAYSTSNKKIYIWKITGFSASSAGFSEESALISASLVPNRKGDCVDAVRKQALQKSDQALDAGKHVHTLWICPHLLSRSQVQPFFFFFFFSRTKTSTIWLKVLGGPCLRLYMIMSHSLSVLTVAMSTRCSTWQKSPRSLTAMSTHTAIQWTLSAKIDNLRQSLFPQGQQLELPGEISPMDQWTVTNIE